MNLVSQPLGRVPSRPIRHQVLPGRSEMIRKALLVCGILSSLVYVALNVFGALAWPAYNSASQAVSELSAIDAPSRPLVLPIGLLYNVLLVGFGWAVWISSPGNRSLRICGALLLVFALLGFTAPFTPMHMRGTDFTLTDTLHITGAMICVLLMFLSITYGGLSFGKVFRWYSFATIILLLAFGALTVPDASRIAANESTPFVGVYERINIGVFMLWVIALAMRLWPREVRNENA